jgi:4-hydroxyphenylpyruvate dioxygenase
MDPLSLSRHYRCYPGQGDYPIGDYLDAVANTGYRGPVSLEIFNDQFRGAAASTIALDGMRSLRALGEQVSAARAKRGAPALPDLAALPPAPEVEGVEFVEFAVSDVDSAALVSLIEGLGFTHAGRHRSKDVELFRQGEINIVVNQDREGFAHAFNILHGPSVCALALRVDSVPKALERARAMDAPNYVGRVGPGETSIPAVAGVEGSLIYFIDEASHRQWPGDFLAETMPDVGGTLTRIDHLSNVVRRSEFLTWSLFYKTVLGLKAEAAVEIADPHGAFFSRSLRSADGALRIPLNISDGGETGVTRFIDAFGGAGYQQIALATDDIFAAVERARGAGVTFLPIPDNYYDDLEARFELAPDLTDRLRRLGVLYDRAKGGEFFHIYTQTFRDRFFFEILQRNNYALFGAANTPVRLAAQARVQDEAQSLRLALDT